VLLIAGLAEALNIIAGFGGQLPFGQVLFFGFGAYVCAWLWMLGYSPILCILAGACLAALLSFPVGFVLFRLKGGFFTMCSLAVSEIVRLAIINYHIMGGSEGFLPGVSPFSVRDNYVLMVVAFAATIVVAYFISKSKFGYGLRALTSDDLAAETVGVNVHLLKILTWAISAFLTGIFGALYAYRTVFLRPMDAFDLGFSLLMVLSALFGGTGSLVGPVFGGIALSSITYFLTFFVEKAKYLIYGLAIILVALLMPRGIWPIIKSRLSRLYMGYQKR
jgi:branched-chain amino acid transport system permease protein